MFGEERVFEGDVVAKFTCTAVYKGRFYDRGGDVVEEGTDWSSRVP